MRRRRLRRTHRAFSFPRAGRRRRGPQTEPLSLLDSPVVKLSNDDPAALEALQRLLRLAAAHLGHDPGELERVVNEIRQGTDLELAWFVNLSGLLVAQYAWKLVDPDGDTDPDQMTVDAANDALRSIEAVLEAVLGDQDPDTLL